MTSAQFLYLVLTAVVAGVGAYFGSYLKKKGGDLATHEDLDKLVDQVKAVTQATKEIEEKISDQMWNRHKRWEIKKDALFAFVKELPAFEEAIVHVVATYGTITNAKTEPIPPEIRQDAGHAHDKYLQARKAFMGAEQLARLVCGQNFAIRCVALREVVRRTVEAAMNNEAELASSLVPQFAGAMMDLDPIIRRELGIPEPSTITLQSSESSAAPIPD